MDCETDALDEAVTFAVKHHKHTGHEVDWERADLESELPESDCTQWSFECHECGRQSQFPTESKAEAFRREHEKYSNHGDSTVEEADPVVDLDDVRELLDYCFDHSETVQIVPKEAVLTALEQNGETKRSMEKKLANLEQESDLYELTHQYLARPSP